MVSTAAAEEESKYHEEETVTMQIYSGKQTSAIDKLKALALQAGVDAAVVAEAANLM